MKTITITQAAAGAGGHLACGTGNGTIGSVVIDSRQAEKETLFVAIKGERQDGHDFAEAAARQGCSFIPSRWR